MKKTHRWSTGRVALAGAGLGLLLAALAIAGMQGIPGDTTADLVLGQDGTSNGGINFIDAASLNSPAGLALDTSVTPHRLFVADPFNNRVLGFPNAESFANGEPASMVLGQPNFFLEFPNQNPNAIRGPLARSAAGQLALRVASTPFARSLVSPSAVAVDAQGGVYVVDSGNNRVVFYPAPVTNDEVATVFLGQGSQAGNSCGASTSARTL